MDHKLKIMGAKQVWEQIDILNGQYGLDYFFETGDSFIVGRYSELLLESRPEHLKKIKFRIYASPDQITEDNIKILKQLNVQEIFLGVESVDENVLKQAGKKYGRKDIDWALKLTYDQGITVQVPFIYGLPGETEESMELSYQYARQIIEEYSEVKLLVSRAIPLIGSKLFGDLRADERVKADYQGDLDKDDSFDYGSLIRLQSKYKTDVSYETVLEYIHKTKELVEEKNTAGFGITSQRKITP